MNKFERLATDSIFIDMDAPTADINTYAETALNDYPQPKRHNTIKLSPIP